jgi:hypothetical protein
MAQAQQPVRQGRPASDTADPTMWLGWLLFGGIMMFVAGALDIIEGLVALFDKSYYRVAPSGLVIHLNYTTWGVGLIVLGVLLMAAGYGVVVGQTWARVFGVVVAVLNSLANFAFVAAAPVWSLLMIALNVVVIYALIVHGREARAFR